MLAARVEQKNGMTEDYKKWRDALDKESPIQAGCGNGVTAGPLRYRQTKEAATDMFGLPSPRHISTYRRRHQPSRPPWENLLEDRMPTTSIPGMRQVDAPVRGCCIPQRRLFPRETGRQTVREPFARLVSLVCSKTVLGVLGILAALVPPAAPANAAEVNEVPAVTSPGNTAEAQVSLGAKLLVCNTCHGAEGVPRNANVPVIWGQREAFLRSRCMTSRAARATARSCRG
jgi:cytochrome c553